MSPQHQQATQPEKVKITGLAKLPAERLDNYADQRGKDYKAIKPNQIRNLYGPIARMRNRFQYGTQIESKEKVRAEIKRGLVLLKPKLAYAVARADNKQRGALEQLREDFNQLIDLLLKSGDDKAFDEALTNFFDLIEAIVAYHKYYSEKKQ